MIQRNPSLDCFITILGLSKTKKVYSSSDALGVHFWNYVNEVLFDQSLLIVIFRNALESCLYIIINYANEN